VLDVGCGAGPGGIVAAREQRHAEVELVLADRNPRALQFASVNAAIAGCDATLAEGDLYAHVEGKFDLIAANAGDHGAALAERIVREGLQRLGPQGRLVLHTHVAIVDGHDPLLEAIEPVLRCGGWRWRYAEMDPDISCGGSMDEGADAAMPERVAAVAVVVERAGR
jgi:16S rRNA G1207 methylase RsmC